MHRGTILSGHTARGLISKVPTITVSSRSGALRLSLVGKRARSQTDHLDPLDSSPVLPQLSRTPNQRQPCTKLLNYLPSFHRPKQGSMQMVRSWSWPSCEQRCESSWGKEKFISEFNWPFGLKLLFSKKLRYI